MKSMIYQSPICEMKEFKNLFIEMTAKNCNMKCHKCYINFPITHNIKDFIPQDKVRDALIDTKSEHIETIYLTGAEPMTHPDFNSILRMCLKRANVCICTNGSFINEKKARFLKKVQEESNFEIIFQLSLDHYDEIKNDDIRSRGSFRQTLHAIKYLLKYEFNPIINVANFYNLTKKDILKNFQILFNQINFDICENNIKINSWQDNSKIPEEIDWVWDSLDCESGRMLTVNGVYTCPYLANDHRGRLGSDFKDFSRKNSLETNLCTNCIANRNAVFSIDYNLFK